MHPFESEITEITEHLQDTYNKIESVRNPNMLLLRNKILLDLKKHIDMLKLQLGIEPNAQGPVTDSHSAPLKKMFGKVINRSGNPETDVNKPFQQTPEDVEFAELKMKTDELYPRFLSIPSDHLLDSVSDIEIRAVAKRAGLPVTETNPKNLTTEYIEQIKKAIQQQNNPVPDFSPASDTGFSNDRSPEVLYSEFSTIENKDILELYSDIEIRAVAKRAGLPVTETFPPKIDKKFLDQMKAAIKKNAELEEIAGNV